jgi:hypothetical protein
MIEEIALFDREGDTGERLQRAVALVDVVEEDGGRHEDRSGRAKMRGARNPRL